ISLLLDTNYVYYFTAFVPLQTGYRFIESPTQEIAVSPLSEEESEEEIGLVIALQARLTAQYSDGAKIVLEEGEILERLKNFGFNRLIYRVTNTLGGEVLSREIDFPPAVEDGSDEVSFIIASLSSSTDYAAELTLQINGTGIMNEATTVAFNTAPYAFTPFVAENELSRVRVAQILPGGSGNSENLQYRYTITPRLIEVAEGEPGYDAAFVTYSGFGLGTTYRFETTTLSDDPLDVFPPESVSFTTASLPPRIPFPVYNPPRPTPTDFFKLTVDINEIVRGEILIDSRLGIARQHGLRLRITSADDDPMLTLASGARVTHVARTWITGSNSDGINLTNVEGNRFTFFISLRNLGLSLDQQRTYNIQASVSLFRSNDANDGTRLITESINYTFRPPLAAPTITANHTNNSVVFIVHSQDAERYVVTVESILPGAGDARLFFFYSDTVGSNQTITLNDLPLFLGRRIRAIAYDNDGLRRVSQETIDTKTFPTAGASGYPVSTSGRAPDISNLQINAMADGFQLTWDEPEGDFTYRFELFPRNVIPSPSFLTNALNRRRAFQSFETNGNTQIFQVPIIADRNEAPYFLYYTKAKPGLLADGGRLQGRVARRFATLSRLSLSPVTNLRATNPNVLTIEVNWTASSGVNTFSPYTAGGDLSYALSYSFDDPDTGEEDGETITGITDTSYTINGIEGLVSYRILVEARYDSGLASDVSIVDIAIPQLILLSPSSSTLSFEAGTNSLRFRWQTVTGIDVYEMSISDAASGRRVFLGEITLSDHPGNSILLENIVLPDTLYTVRARALGDLERYVASGFYDTTFQTIPEARVRLRRNDSEFVELFWDSFQTARDYRMRAYEPDTQPQEFFVPQDQEAAEIKLSVPDLLGFAQRYVFEVQSGGLQTATTRFATVLATPEVERRGFSETQLSVAWQTINQAERYRVEVYEGMDDQGTTLVDEQFITDIAYTVPVDLFAGTNYTIYVTAVDDDDIYPSSRRFARTLQTEGERLPTLERPLLETPIVQGREAQFSWNSIALATSYELSLYLGNKIPGQRVQRVLVGGSTNDYNFEMLESERQYILRLIAVGDGINYANSMQTTAVFTTLKLQIDNLELSQNDANLVVLSWDEFVGANGYVFRNYLSAGTAPALFSNPVTTTSVSFFTENLEPNSEYTFELRGEGITDVDRAPGAVTTFNTALSAIIIDTPVASETGITWQWQSVPEAEEYSVQVFQVNPSDSREVFLELAIVADNPDSLGNIVYQTLETLNSGISYTIHIIARDTDNLYPNSGEATSTHQAGTNTLTGVGVPENIRVAVEHNEMTVSWEASTTGREQAYLLNLYLGGNVMSIPLKSDRLGSNDFQHTFTGLLPDTQYTIRLIGLGDKVSFNNSPPAIQTASTLLPPLQDFVLEENDARRVIISWSAFATATGYQYRVYAMGSTTPAFSAVAGEELGLRVEIDTRTLLSAVAYRLDVFAAGDESEIISQIGTFQFNSALPTPAFNTDAISNDEITISWNHATGATEYRVDLYQGEDDISGSFLRNQDPFFDMNTNAQILIVSPLDAGITYSFYITALDDTGTYPDSERFKLTLTTSLEGALPRADIPMITRVSPGPFQISLVWNQANNANEYEVNLYEGGVAFGSPFANVILLAEETRHTFDNLIAGTEYTVRVRALGDRINYVDSEGAVETETTTFLQAPRLSLETNSLEEIKLSWSPIERATHYLYRLHQTATQPDSEATTRIEETMLSLEGEALSNLEIESEYTFEVTAFEGENRLTPATATTFNTALSAPKNTSIIVTVT
ncbi:MAG: fibronectin type III domain-containing protein, partial [Candidatus Oxydemutatoraceae bacterium WSBS_2016_MAG_OTU14]